MKILFIQEFGDTFGGVQKLITELALAIAATGEHDVTLMVHRQDDEQYADLLRKNGVSLINLGMNGRFSLLKAWRYITVARRGNYDIIHTNHTIPQLIGAFIKPICRKNTHWVTTEHSVFGMRRNHKWFRRIDRRAYRAYDSVVSVSNTVQQSLLEWLREEPGPRFRVVYNGIDTQRLLSARPAIRHEMGFKEGDFVVLTIGRLCPEKDFSTFIRAMSLLPEQYKGVIVGDGDCRELLQREAKEQHLEGRILFTGARHDIGSLLKMANLYVSTSTSEGFGLTVIEAAVCGIPVIASNIPAFRELLPEERLFTVGNAQQLKHLITTCGNAPLTGTDYASIFSLQAMTNHYLDIYNALIRREKRQE